MPDATITISSGPLAAIISPDGAELQALTDTGGTDYLWNGDATWWTGRAPILFPIVGALSNDRHVVDGKSYTLAKHGFARRSRFTTVAQSATSVTFRLEASDATLAVYPYAFRLDITYELAAETLKMTATVTNTGTGPMPASFGYHPAFLWPLPGAGSREAQVITFSDDEPVPASRIDAQGLVARLETASRVHGRQLRLPDDLFDEDALLFLSPASRALRFGADGQGTALDIRFPGMPHLGIWTKPGGAPFLCIEPWSGYASPTGFEGPLMEKPGMTVVASGEARDFSMSVTLVHPAG